MSQFNGWHEPIFWPKGKGPGDYKPAPIAKTVAGQAYNHWLPLHRYAPKHAGDWNADKAEDWYNRTWKPNIPSGSCNCGEHWRELESKYPPDFSSAKAFFEWGWERHNDVSRLHSHRPQITLDEAYKLFWSSFVEDTSLAQQSR